MKKLIVILCMIFVFESPAQDKKMCITIDDLPTVPYEASGHKIKFDITHELISVFEKYDIPAIGYVNEYKLYKNGTIDSAEVKLLELWLQHDLELGNHTYSHVNYHTVPFETYTDEILKGEIVTKDLAEKYRSEVRYFRHPYLRAGLRKSHADSLITFLEQHGYTEAPVTIDNEDYLFAAAYSKAALGLDTALMRKIGNEYVNYMEEKLVFYERQSMKMFERHIDQILLVHASLLNAHYMEKLVTMCIEHGYSFVSQTEILEDEAYEEEVTRFGDWGISWIDRWALSRGKRGDFFAGDPLTPEYIQKLAN